MAGENKWNPGNDGGEEEEEEEEVDDIVSIPRKTSHLILRSDCFTGLQGY